MSGDGKNAIPNATLGLASNALEDPEDDPHPMFFNVTRAVSEIRAQCLAGRIVARGVASDTGRVRELLRDDWAYGSLSFGNNMEEVWSVPGLSFGRLTFFCDDVLRVWPQPALEVPKTPSDPGRPPLLKDEIEHEFIRSRTVDDPPPLESIAEEAGRLLRWARAKHPGTDLPARRTVENNIRAFYHAAKNGTLDSA